MNFGDSGPIPEDIALFMDSIFLKKLKKNVGLAVHSLNTICVGLSFVRDGEAKKPDDLDVRWNPSDKVQSADIAHSYVVRASYVFVSSAFVEYLKEIKSVFDFSIEDLKVTDAAQIINLFESKISTDDSEKYRWIFLKLLVHNRNLIVHGNSRAKLTSNEKNELISQKEHIFENHCHLDVIEMLQHSESRMFTLKEISTLATNAIFMANQIDKKFQERINSADRIILTINNTCLKDAWDKLCKLRKKGSWERKKKFFLSTNFPFVSDSKIINSICQNK